MANSAALLNADDATGLELIRDDAASMTLLNNKFRVYTYRQRMDELEVHASVLKIPVLLGAIEKIGFVTMQIATRPPNWPPDLVSANDALAIVASLPAYDHLTDFTALAQGGCAPNSIAACDLRRPIGNAAPFSHNSRE